MKFYTWVQMTNDEGANANRTSGSFPLITSPRDADRSRSRNGKDKRNVSIARVRGETIHTASSSPGMSLRVVRSSSACGRAVAFKGSQQFERGHYIDISSGTCARPRWVRRGSKIFGSPQSDATLSAALYSDSPWRIIYTACSYMQPMSHTQAKRHAE